MDRLNYSDALDYFAGTYTEMIEDCIPKIKSVKGKKNKYLTWEAMKCKHKSTTIGKDARNQRTILTMQVLRKSATP